MMIQMKILDIQKVFFFYSIFSNDVVDFAKVNATDIYGDKLLSSVS